MIKSVVLGALRLAFWPSIHLTTEDIVVRNPIRTVRLPLTDLVRCSPSRDGLVLTSITGETVVAWTLQKGIGLSVLGVRTRADRAEELIKATATRAWEDAGFIPPRTLRSRRSPPMAC